MTAPDLYYQAADDILAALGAQPSAPALNCLVAWSLAEWGGTNDLAATNNPLATEYPKSAPGIVGNWNPQGVLMFASLRLGAAACAQVMQGYPSLVAALRAGSAATFFSSAGLYDLAVWAGGPSAPNYEYAANVQAIYGGLGAPPGWAVGSPGGPASGSTTVYATSPSPWPWLLGGGLLLAGGALVLRRRR